MSCVPWTSGALLREVLNTLITDNLSMRRIEYKMYFTLDGQGIGTLYPGNYNLFIKVIENLQNYDMFPR